MRPKTKAALWVFLFLAGVVRVFSRDFIVTDAAGGIFTSDRKLSFELSSPGSLKLLLDEREIYRGGGPAYPELGFPQGEERGFTLRAEYYSPENELLESRSWHIYIDKKPPAFPLLEFRDTPEGFRLVQPDGEKNTIIRALAEIEGKPVFFEDVEKTALAPAASFEALVWAEDLAGNRSEIRNEYFEIPPFKIENPVPGEWRNFQTLIISGTEGKDIYWTSDGTDPLAPGGTGRPYRGLERIKKNGAVTLRAAWRDSAGRLHESRVDYSVTGDLTESGVSNESRYSALEAAEEREINSPSVLPVPDFCLWSMGGAPRLEGGKSVTLRPEARIKRTAVLHLSPAADTGGVYRFVYLLNGNEKGGAEASAVFPTAALSEIPLLTGTPARPEAGPESADSLSGETGPEENSGNNSASPPVLIRAGKRRLVLWPEIEGVLYFALRDGPWLKAEGPLPIPLEGGKLRWFALEGEGEDSGENGADLSGPAGVVFPSLAENESEVTLSKEIRKGRLACRVFGENTGWDYVSPLLDYVPGALKNTPPDVCDGEDLEWAFISGGGEILEQCRRDRLAPPAPELAAPPQGSWNRGPVKAGVAPGAEELTDSVSVKLRYASGAVETFEGSGILDIVSSLGEEAEVTLEAFLTDSAGNRGMKTVRNFLLDPKTIYVSSDPLLAGASLPASDTGHPAGPKNPPLPGGMDNPFTSLEEALDFALKQDRGDIRISGTHELKKPLTISRNIRIAGDWKKSGGRASLSFGDAFSWNISPGAGLALSGINAERKKGDEPLFQAGRNSSLEIVSSAFNHTGSFLSMDSGVCKIRDSLIAAETPEETRSAVFSLQNSRLETGGSSIQLKGNDALLFDLSLGAFIAEDSVFHSSGERTASVFVLSGTRGEFTNLSLSASGRDFAAVLEASGSELVLSGGTVKVSARDSCAFMIDKCAALFFDAAIRLEGSSTARALEISGSFPRVQNCGFSFSGSAKNSRVFSGTEAAEPSPGGIAGNNFLGFAQILMSLWPVDKLPDFNRAYASPDNPNSAGTAPGGGF